MKKFRHAIAVVYITEMDPAKPYSGIAVMDCPNIVGRFHNREQAVRAFRSLRARQMAAHARATR